MVALVGEKSRVVTVRWRKVAAVLGRRTMPAKYGLQHAYVVQAPLLAGGSRSPAFLPAHRPAVPRRTRR